MLLGPVGPREAMRVRGGVWKQHVKNARPEANERPATDAGDQWGGRELRKGTGEREPFPPVRRIIYYEK